MILTPTQLARIRKNGQGSVLYLAVPQYATIYTARLASLPAGHSDTSTDMVTEITVSGGVGTLSNIIAGMTLYVGTTAGAYDVGMCRMRKTPTGTTWALGETSEIDWTVTVLGGLYLTVVSDYGLWAKPLKITDENVYMDVDIAYSNQHSACDPVPLMGSHWAQWLRPNAVITPDGSGSWVLDSTITGYTWSFPGAASTSGTATATPSATYDTPGTYIFSLTVTAANGKSYTGYRYAMFFDDDNPPITQFTLDSCRANTDGGGWEFDVTLYAEADRSQIRDRALCILFADDYFGNELEDCPSQVTGNENIIAVGWVSEENNIRQPYYSTTSMSIKGAHYWLDKMTGFPCGVEMTTGAPTAWTEIKTLTVQKYLWHLLHWRSTATRVMDVTITDDARYAKDLNSLEESLWRQITENAYTTIYATPGVDRYGRLWVEIEPLMESVADRTWDTVFEIEPQDWQNEVEWMRVVTPPVGKVNLSGITVDASISAASYFSLSPGHVYKRHGEPYTEDRLLVGSQEKSNELAGLYAGWYNNPNPPLHISLACNMRAVDLWPRQFVGIDLPASYDTRGIGLSGNCVPRGVEFHHNAETGFLHTEMDIEPETQPEIGVKGDVPGQEDFDFSVPPLPPLPPLPPIIYPADDPTIVLLHDSNYGFIYTETFNTPAPVWKFVNAGLGDERKYFNRIFTNKYGRVYAATLNDSTSSHPVNVYTVAYPGGFWTKLIDETWIRANVTFTNPSSIARLDAFGYNPNAVDAVAFIAGEESGPPGYIHGNFFVGNYSSFSAGADLLNVSSYNGAISYGAGKWWLTGRNKSVFPLGTMWDFGSNGGTQSAPSQLSVDMLPSYHIRAEASDVVYWYKNSILYRCVGTSFTDLSTGIGNILETQCGLATDPSSQYVLTSGAPSSNQKLNYSTDYGSTFSEIDILPAVSYYAVGWALTSVDRWVAARKGVYYSNNSWVTAYDKTGNLAEMFIGSDTPKIDYIKVIA